MALVKARSRGINLADTFAFSGTVSGAGGGKIGQVVQGTKSGGQTISSSSYTAVSSLTANITCSATSSKVLIMISIPTITISSTDNEGGDYSLYRGGSAEYKFGGNHGYATDSSGSNQTVEFTKIHEPSSTSQQTYSVYAKKNGNSNLEICANSTQATITLMEILA
tara:strand:- start:804 stop:1301 length:498 start_codon:yes stop_codon:yes gene_type:complete